MLLVTMLRNPGIIYSIYIGTIVTVWMGLLIMKKIYMWWMMNTMGENPSAIKYMTSIRRTTLFGPINHAYTGFSNALFKQLNGEREKSIR